MQVAASSQITIRRTSAWAGRLFPWHVSIDGKSVGNVANGSTLTCEVEPGSRRVEVKGAFRTPAVLVLTVENCASVEISATPQEPPGGGGPLWPASPRLHVSRVAHNHADG